MPGLERINTFLTDIDVDGTAIRIARAKYGLIVIRAVDLFPQETPDAELLAYAAAQGYVMVTGNIRDFPRTAQWLAQGKSHSGLIFVISKHGKNPEVIARGLAVYRDGDLSNQEIWI